MSGNDSDAGDPPASRLSLAGLDALRRLARGPLHLDDLHPNTVMSLLRRGLIAVNGGLITITPAGQAALAQHPSRAGSVAANGEQPDTARAFFARQRAKEHLEHSPPPRSEPTVQRLIVLFDRSLPTQTFHEYYCSLLKAHLQEPLVDFVTNVTGPGPANRFFAGHGYRLDAMLGLPHDAAVSVRDLVEVHDHLHRARPWPHRHRRLHSNELSIYSAELDLPRQLVATLSSQQRMASFPLPPAEAQARQALLALRARGIEYAYTRQGQALWWMHQTPTEEDLLALPAPAATVLYCAGLYRYAHGELGEGDLIPVTLAEHNRHMRLLRTHPERRAWAGDRWRVFLSCRDCRGDGRLTDALRDPSEPDERN